MTEPKEAPKTTAEPPPPPAEAPAEAPQVEPPAAPRAEEPLPIPVDPVQKELKKGVTKVQDQIQYENQKKMASEELQTIKKEKEQTLKDIQDNQVKLNARVIELDRYIDFLSIDPAAHEAIVRSIRFAQPSHPWRYVSAISGLIAVGSGAVYTLPIYTKNFANVTPPENENFWRRTVRSIGQDLHNYGAKTNVHIGSGFLAAGTTAISLGSLVVDYYLNNPLKDASYAQARVYLSQFVSDNRNNFLPDGEIDNLLSTRIKNTQFCNALLTEMDKALHEIDDSANTVALKQASLDKLTQDIYKLNQELAESKMTLKYPENK